MSTIKEIAGCFSGIIGQGRIVENRILAHSAFAMGCNAACNLLLTGAAGLGKTRLLQADLLARKTAVEIRAKRDAETVFLRSPQDVRLAGDAFFSLIESIESGDGVAIDELHEIDIRPTVQTAKIKGCLKGLMDGNAGAIRSVRLDDDTTISRHVSEIYFSGGTNFPEKLKDGAAIISRFGGETPLALYSVEELTQILLAMAKGVGLRIAENTVSLIARCGRGTARPLEHIIAHLARVAVIAGKDTINRVEALDAMRSLELYPFGVSAREVSMMVRSKGAGLPVRMIPIVYAIEPKAASLSLAFLSSLHFIAPVKGVATLTTHGAAYLDQLKAEKFTIPA
jgi:Holliday junction resolvasome RuvABC ATP-dependent DNA helicase subunit